ncbi:MAG: hypothetical protein ABW202_03840 [Duganella sp.]
MALQFDITAGFKSDLTAFSSADQALIAQSLDEWGSRVNVHAGLIPSPVFFQPRISVLSDEVESSLYGMCIGQRIRLVLTMEHDPLFEQDIWTLIKAVPSNEFDAAFQCAAGLLYPGLLDESLKHG